MNTIHISPEAQAQIKKERDEKFKAFEKKLVLLMIEEKVAVVPRIEYMTNTIASVIGFEEIPDEKVEEYRKRIG